MHVVIVTDPETGRYFKFMANTSDLSTIRKFYSKCFVTLG